MADALHAIGTEFSRTEDKTFHFQRYLRAYAPER